MLAQIDQRAWARSWDRAKHAAGDLARAQVPVKLGRADRRCRRSTASTCSDCAPVGNCLLCSAAAEAALGDPAAARASYERPLALRARADARDALSAAAKGGLAALAEPRRPRYDRDEVGSSARLALAVLSVLVTASPRVVAAPSPPPPGGAQSNIEQAKAVYGEAMKALEAKDYWTALAKFEQAYKLAPDKHLFNYNIASAAELAGDCRKAEKHYKMFLDLVPKHEARKGVGRTLEKLAKTCQYDEESTTQLSTESRGDREAERKKAIADRAATEALEAAQQSVARYEAVIAKHGRQQPFARVLRAKRRDAKKIAKLLAANEIEAEGYTGKLEPPGSLEQACRQGEAQEERNAAAYGNAYERVEDDELAELMDKLMRKAEGSHGRAFRDGCPRR